jgi:putative SOS response-associated peptidase YedK
MGTGSISLASGDPRKPDWPEAYAILTVEANPDVALYHDRQMVVLRREQRLDWLDSQVAEDKLLRPLPAGSFRVKEVPPTLGF